MTRMLSRIENLEQQQEQLRDNLDVYRPDCCRSITLRLASTIRGPARE